MVLAFFHLSGFANRLRLRRIAMCVLHVSIGMSTCECQVETELDCKEPPLAFRTDNPQP